MVKKYQDGVASIVVQNLYVVVAMMMMAKAVVLTVVYAGVKVVPTVQIPVR
jgi:hypothetical protein